jgi:hypothetical protein
VCNQATSGASKAHDSVVRRDDIPLRLSECHLCLRQKPTVEAPARNTVMHALQAIEKTFTPSRPHAFIQHERYARRSRRGPDHVLVLPRSATCYARGGRG